ncbi:Oidioi.mRNA.OKI2018_I69.XSR.g13533.t1.cds [Oikopleura dioica]|uniref:Oidioi.mRNA.OKI2018_I69.XSR.g13533.t1.cds n=1 Tax=Oikopleura dioica TaxID=34765 RepID=A0ABN7SBV6_OIKDI|nr:Oidioi.mRNA.OKI2018_I69.XSR.g13533.t1.cds [Oikopleura dioica]
MVKDIVDQAIAANKVMVFSKTYCPFCTKAKDALKSVGASFEVMEIENRSDMDAIQDYLKELTGARSVPRVFVNGKFYGGGDDTSAGAANGDLAKKIAE